MGIAYERDAYARGAVGIDTDPFEPAVLPLRAPVWGPEVLRSRAPQARGSRLAKLAVVGADSVAIALSMIVAAFVRGVVLDRPEAVGPIALTGVLALPIWLCVFARYKLYSAAAVSSQTAEIRRVVHAIAFAVALTGLITFSLAQNVSRVWLLMTFAAALAIVTSERAVARGVFRRVRRNGNLERRVVVVGSNREALGIVQDLRSDPALGYRVLGLITSDGAQQGTSAAPVLGSWHDAVAIVQGVEATGVIVATSAIDAPVANRLARELIEIGCHVELTSGLVDISTDRLLTRPLARRPVMYIQPVRRAGWRAVAKRVFDVGVAAGLLMLTAPLLAVTAILIKLDSRGTVFFSQVRVGKGGNQFRLVKFRTMVADAETLLDRLQEHNEMQGPLFKMRDDPRVTRVGRVLRNFSIDELPQLWNVIRGEMSIVGPRPALPTEASTWTDEQRNRVSVKPGITGMWQVNGRSESSFDEYVRHDLYYVDNWSLLTDLAIVAKTIPAVLLRRGAY